MQFFICRDPTHASSYGRESGLDPLSSKTLLFLDHLSRDNLRACEGTE